MTIEQPDISGMGALSPARGFMMNATGKTKELEQTDSLNQARLQFPYPPKDCQDGMNMIANIQSLIKDKQQLLASGVLKGSAAIRQNNNDIVSLQTVLGEFQVFVNNMQCVQNALNEQDNAFTNQLQSALQQEQSTSTAKSTTDNFLVIGGIGLLIVTAIVLILSKSKPKTK